jgi:hypothetical protein
MDPIDTTSKIKHPIALSGTSDTDATQTPKLVSTVYRGERGSNAPYLPYLGVEPNYTARERVKLST